MLKTWELNREPTTKQNHEQKDEVEAGSVSLFVVDSGGDDDGGAGRTRTKGGGARRNDDPMAASELAELEGDEEDRGAWRTAAGIGQ